MQNTLELFFKYLEEETFEDGASFMENLNATTKKEKAYHSELETLRYFCSSFLRAKHIVEISYSYAEARALYEEAASTIRKLDSDFFTTLADFAQMQASILRIDRAIYTGYAPQMSKAAKELKDKTEIILNYFTKESDECSHVCYETLKNNLVKKLEEDNTYAKAIIIVAELYLSRWQKNSDLESQLSKVQKSVELLEEAGNERLASDLAPHIHVIKRFNERRGEDGKLFIKNGEVALYYYGSLDYRVREEFNQVLKKITDGNAQLSVQLEKLLGSIQMIKEEMTDIWSGLASLEFINTYKFKLNNMKILNFRNIESLEANVELKYYTMGIFEIKISFLIDNDYLSKQNEGLSLSALRHLQSLGTPFALDENIVIQNQDTTYGYIAEYIDAKFELFSSSVVSLLKYMPDILFLPDKKAITFDSEQNRFTLVRINQIVQSLESKSIRLRSQDFKQHFQYKALVMPVREVRSAIDNWIMYDSLVIDENIAGIRYNESEWLSINPYQGVVALLEQPVWVFDQAIESVEVASAVLNLLNLSNIQASTQLKNISKKREDVDTRLKPQALKALSMKLESEIGHLDLFKIHMANLLETVEAGSIMTYPDHTILMEKIFKIMSLDRHTKKANSLQAQLKDKRTKSMEIIKKIDKAVSYSQQKMIKFVVSIASVFIALGSLADIFGLWNDSKTIQSFGLADPDGDFKLSFVLLLAVVSTSWLLYDNYIRDKK